MRNAIVHDGFWLDTRQIDKLCWKIEFDLREEEAQARLEEMEHRTWTGSCSNGFPI